MDVLSLPASPSLEHLRKLAKALRRNVASGDVQAIDTLREFYPNAPLPLSLSHAQVVIARQHGSSSWPALKQRVELLQSLSRMPDPAWPEDAPLADQFIRLACLHYRGGHRSSFERARALLAQHPDLPRASIFSAATAGDVVAVRAMLDADPSLVTVSGGPHDWSPLLYAAYSRGADTLEVGRLLIGRGADPNDGYLWDGVYPFTALTGVLGEGEAGPVHQPKHPRLVEFATALLEAGADANDAQGIYNRQFTDDDDFLQLLLRYGFGKSSTGPWFDRIGAAWAESEVRTPKHLAEYLLRAAAVHGYTKRATLLLDHGVDPSGDAGGGQPAVNAAARAGRTDMVALFVARGASRPVLEPMEILLSMVASGDAALGAFVEAHPDVVQQALAQRPDLICDAAEKGHVDTVQALLDLGFPTDVWQFASPLHSCAGSGSVEVAKMLVKHGADLYAEDPLYHSTPLGWAEYQERSELTVYLRSVMRSAGKS